MSSLETALAEAAIASHAFAMDTPLKAGDRVRVVDPHCMLATVDDPLASHVKSALRAQLATVLHDERKDESARADAFVNNMRWLNDVVASMAAAPAERGAATGEVSCMPQRVYTALRGALATVVVACAHPRRVGPQRSQIAFLALDELDALAITTLQPNRSGRGPSSLAMVMKLYDGGASPRLLVIERNGVQLNVARGNVCAWMPLLFALRLGWPSIGPLGVADAAAASSSLSNANSTGIISMSAVKGQQRPPHGQGRAAGMKRNSDTNGPPSSVLQPPTGGNGHAATAVLHQSASSATRPSGSHATGAEVFFDWPHAGSGASLAAWFATAQESFPEYRCTPRDAVAAILGNNTKTLKLSSDVDARGTREVFEPSSVPCRVDAQLVEARPHRWHAAQYCYLLRVVRHADSVSHERSEEETTKAAAPQPTVLFFIAHGQELSRLDSLASATVKAQVLFSCRRDVCIDAPRGTPPPTSIEVGACCCRMDGAVLSTESKKRSRIDDDAFGADVFTRGAACHLLLASHSPFHSHSRGMDAAAPPQRREGRIIGDQSDRALVAHAAACLPPSVADGGARAGEGAAAAWYMSGFMRWAVPSSPQPNGWSLGNGF